MKKFVIVLFVLFFGFGHLQAKERAKGLRHLVLIKFKEGTTADQIARIDSLVWKMAKEIKEIKKLEWGKSLGLLSETKEYDYCLNIVFKSENDMMLFSVHPAYQKFKAAIIPITAKIIRFNYIIR